MSRLPRPHRLLLWTQLSLLLPVCAFHCQPTLASPMVQDDSSLRDHSRGLFQMGVGTSHNAVREDADAALIETHFSLLTPENCMKPAATQNNEGEFKFDNTDRVMKFANDRGLSVVGHCLVWAKDDRTPEWFYKDGNQPASKELLLKRMKTHIETVIDRYGDQIDQWDVVNEALADGGSETTWRDSQWRSIFGDSEFIVKAFEIAHAADPTAMLIYNDYRSELPGKREKLFELIKYLKSKNTPVHAIGLQGHYELDNVPFEDLEFTLGEIRKLGLKVVISEVDIDIVKRGKWWADGNIHREELKSYDPYKDGCPPEILKRQADQYAKLFEIYARHSDIIERVTFWNLHDGQSWLNYFPWNRANHPLLFDRERKTKPAYDSVAKVLDARRATLQKELTKVSGVDVDQIGNGTVIPLWKNGAPGFEDRKDEPEQAKDWWVKNIHNPSLTAYLPSPEKATGAAAVIIPGGGHRLLVFDAEGVEAAKHLNELGIAAFVLKHRLGREENSPYKIEVHAKQDGQRAMRWVRAHAAQLNLDPNKIGIYGFSAGGEVVSMVAYSNHEGDPNSADLIEQASAKPNFQILIYPGPLGIPETLPSDTPPAFLLVANNDGAANVVLDLTQKLRAAKVSVEMHLLAQGGHGFNMGNRTELKSVSSWRERLEAWIEDNLK